MGWVRNRNYNKNTLLDSRRYFLRRSQAEGPFKTLVTVFLMISMDSLDNQAGS
jgi:hypothetical protein